MCPNFLLSIASNCLKFTGQLFILSFLFFYELIWSFVPKCLRKRQSLHRKVVLITGAGRGIGRAIALRLAREGAILILWDVDGITNVETQRLVLEIDPDIEVHSFTIDVGQRAAVFSAADFILRGEIGKIDVLINNAGIVNGRYLTDMNEADINRCFSTNILGQFWACQAFLPEMIKSKSGHIVAIGSVGGIVGTSKLTDYCATKFAVNGLMESLQIELENRKMDKHIKLTTICPYFVDTRLFSGIKTKYRCLLPILKADFVAERTVDAILYGKHLVLIPNMLYLLLGFKGILPWTVLKYLGYMFGAHTAMNTFNAIEDNCQNQANLLNGANVGDQEFCI